MLAPLLTPEISELIKNKDWKTLKNILSGWPAPDVADIIQSLDDKDMLLLYRFLPIEQASEVFAELESHNQELVLNTLNDDRLKEIFMELSVDDRTELMEELPGELTQKILNLFTNTERGELMAYLGYPEYSVGRLVTPDYVAVKSDWNVERAIRHIRRRGRDAETINVVYIVDARWKLLDDIPIRRFILADPEERVENLMDGHYISIPATDDQEQSYNLMKRYDLNILPVVDSTNTLIGIVTIDDIIDVMEEEVTEDFQKSSAISPFETSYISTSPFLLYRKRVGWLLILLLADFLSSSVIAHFQGELQAVIALTFFIPVLIDSGGNTSSQSSTLIIRAIAIGELSLGKWFKVIQKELVTGLLLGITLGAALYARSFFWKGGPEIGMVVGISMICIILWANILGSLLPIVLTKLKLDPAVISSPLLTTVVDSTGLIIYFSVANVLLHIH
ncbi:MAG TPA: magnesium transporter [Balneolales bacterium]|nr:magnesium transporter [Balneolales bacterium]